MQASLTFQLEGVFTQDGFPFIYATSMLGSFLLTYVLGPHLSEDARIFFFFDAGRALQSICATSDPHSLLELSDIAWNLASISQTRPSKVTEMPLIALLMARLRI